MEKRFFVFLFLSISLFCQPLSFSHTPAKSFQLGEKFSVWLRTQLKPQFVLIFYKVGDIEYYQVRKMKKVSEGEYFFEFDSSRFTAKKLQYHFVARVEGKYLAFPEKGDFTVIGQGQLPPVPVVEERKVLVKPVFNLSGNLQWNKPIKSKTGVLEEASLNGNLTITAGVRSDEVSFALTGTVAHDSQFQQDPTRLTALVASLSSLHHSFQLGDVNFQAHDLIFSGGARRGGKYELNLERIKASLFYLSSQQLTGLGLPSGEAHFEGASLAFLAQGVNLHLILIRGKDRPGTSEYSQDLVTDLREGRVISAGFALSLLQNALNLKGDIFHSSYDDNVADDVPAKTDTAYAFSGSLSKDILYISADYRRVGANYNSIASSYIASNQESLTGNLSLNFPKLSLSTSYSKMKSNIASLQGIPVSTNSMINTSLNYQTEKVSFGIGYQYNHQLTDVEENMGVDTEIKAGQFTLNFGLNPSQNFSMQISAGSSLTSGTEEQKSYSLAFSMNARLSSYFLVSPSFNYLSTLLNNQETRTISAYLTYYLTLIPKAFSISGNSSYSEVKTPQGVGDTKSLSLSSRASLLLEWIWSRFGQSAISIEAQYLWNEISGMSSSDWKIFASAVISF